MDSTISLSKVSCHGQPLVLSCPLGYSISVTRGLHGRLDSTTCVSGSQLNTTAICIVNTDVASLVKEQCNGLNSCVFQTTAIDANNCKGISLYTSIEFKCLCKYLFGYILFSLLFYIFHITISSSSLFFMPHLISYLLI